MTKRYYVEGIEWIKTLGDADYEWKAGYKLGDGASLIERIIKQENQEKITPNVITIDHQYKTVQVFPAEVLAPGSPTADAEKLEKILNQCGTIEDLEKEILENQKEQVGQNYDQEI